MSYYREQLESFLKTLEVDAESVADIGGASLPVNDRVKRWNVQTYHILDNFAEEQAQANFTKWNTNNDTIKLKNADFNTELYIGFRNYYDYVFCLEVFEYIYNPVAAILNISKMLKSGGRAVITFPTIYPLHNPLEIDYMRYTFSGVKKLLELADFSKFEIISRTPKIEGYAALDAFYKIDGMHPVKNSKLIFDTGYIVTAIK